MVLAAILLAASLAAVNASPVLQLKRANATTGTYVTDIAQCPRVAARATKAASVHDLRPDDFDVVMAIGDSITAGAFAKGIQSDVLQSFNEWRGVSYAGGGDPGATTIPNLIKYYRSSVVGASTGYHGVELCFGILCPLGPFGWNAPVDNFNAAQTGALASNLLHEVRDYLVPQVKDAGIPNSAFKYLNFQIGSNDICQMCAGALTPTAADSFEDDVRSALEYVRKNIPNVLVNVIGVIPVAQIYPLTLDQPYCQKLLPGLPHLNIECSCALLGGAVGNATRTLMNSLTDQYNERLQKIVKDYQRAGYKSFAATWQPPNIPLSSYPIEALSDVDCFHPSQATHARIAAAVWNRLTLATADRAEVFAWADTPVIRCLQDTDRIQTKDLIA
ncbi:hypothetical protein EXIGLDRAFT_772595 [Exidia glandulosa HHB12029]|uniref:SGNH hydrolase n=1 Tax=Exidia glandulosa HHB12029 TaxID=1314781 RepID=A0A165F839_EXIGL|nr:hypothetical protein EXIGLDRAFT_772595 [Exidia glandulosa HHB12029]